MAPEGKTLIMNLRVEIPHDKETAALRMTNDIESYIQEKLAAIGLAVGNVHVQLLNREQGGLPDVPENMGDILLDNDEVRQDVELPDGLGQEI